MSGKKQEFVEALQALPSGLAEFVSTPIPEIPEVAMPITVDEAILATGKVSVNINNVLRTFSGMTPIALSLRLGQHHPAYICMLLASLQAVSEPTGFDIIAPENGGIYPGYFDSWMVRAPGIESLAVTLGEDEFTMTRNGEVFSKNWPVPIGSHTATITGMKDDEPVSEQTVSFSVVEFETFPMEGATYRPEQIDRVSVNVGTISDDVLSVSAELFDMAVDLVEELDGQWQKDGLTFENLSASAYQMTVFYSLAAAGALTQVVEFFISE